MEIYINQNTASIKEIVCVMSCVFYKQYPDKESSWYEEQIKNVDLKKSYFIYSQENLIGIYLMNEKDEPYKKMKGKGIKGECLAILPEFQRKGIFKKIYQLLQKSDYDYFWGQQNKILNNLKFWSKYRSVIYEDKTHWVTAGYLKIT
jgi:hypothetical protein